jgi:hypothetical protein
MYMVMSENIPKQSLYPKFFNYFGLMNPDGKNFGQMALFIPDVMLTRGQL